jgi:hypothetical protein
MIYLLHHMGLRGLAAARVCYGLIALIVYLPLVRAMSNPRTGESSTWAMAASGELQEGSQP